MKKIAILSFSLFVWACNNDNVKIGGAPATDKKPAKPATAKPSAPMYVYGNKFRVYNAGQYESLLKVCRRCGTRRIVTNSWGGTSYQRFWTFGENPKRCSNWNSSGYIQVAFAENKLPTEATVSFQPEYVAGAQSQWGQPFELKAPARPVNENKGFQILLGPADGYFEGNYSMEIYSRGSNHVKSSQLDITVTYGTGEQAIISAQLVKLKSPAISSAPFDCGVWTN